MFIDWLAKKDLEDSEHVIIRVAGVVIFAVAAFVINELFFWHSSLILLAGISVIGGSIGFFVAKASPVTIKAIPLVVVFSLAAIAVKGVYEHFYFKIVYIEPFLAETDNCKALGLELINKHNFAGCLSKDSRTIKQSCQRVIDNEWTCNPILMSDVIARPEGHKRLQVVIVE